MTATFKTVTSYLFAFVGFFSLSIQAHAGYAFGLFPEDNNPAEIVELEKKYDIETQIIGYTFDTFGYEEESVMKRSVELLGKDRVYHVSVSPYGFSAKAVADGEYDAEYRSFFRIVKHSGIKVLFRTMHEMNGSWYSWSGDPANFKKAWKRVYELSREEWLDSQSILFIMSVNSQDLPTADGSIGGAMVSCSPANKKLTGCVSFEDYYPGNEYVDVMGITLYNWGRGRGEYWAKWRSFPDLLLDKNTKMFPRLVSYGKPIFLDEVGTTAVNFSGAWSIEKARDSYRNHADSKNSWISGFKAELSQHPQIVGAMYFNRDKTDGLTLPKTGELDWSALSLRLDKEYPAVLDFWDDSRADVSSLPFGRDYVIEKAKKKSRKIIAKIISATKRNPSVRSEKTREELEKLSQKIEKASTKSLKRYWQAVYDAVETKMEKRENSSGK